MVRTLKEIVVYGYGSGARKYCGPLTGIVVNVWRNCYAVRIVITCDFSVVFGWSSSPYIPGTYGTMFKFDTYILLR